MHTEVLFYFFHLCDKQRSIKTFMLSLFTTLSWILSRQNWYKLTTLNVFFKKNGSMHINLSGDKHPIELSVWDKII